MRDTLHLRLGRPLVYPEQKDRSPRTCSLGPVHQFLPPVMRPPTSAVFCLLVAQSLLTVFFSYSCRALLPFQPEHPNSPSQLPALPTFNTFCNTHLPQP